MPATLPPLPELPPFLRPLPPLGGGHSYSWRSPLPYSEYYDRDLPPAPLRNPNTRQQDAYWFLRASLTRALLLDWQRVLDASPATLHAYDALLTFTDAHPDTAFQIFRSEDASATHQGGDPLFLR